MGDKSIKFAEFFGGGLGRGHYVEEALAEFFGPGVFGVVEDLGGVFAGSFNRDADESGVNRIDAGAGHKADDKSRGHQVRPSWRSCSQRVVVAARRILSLAFMSISASAERAEAMSWGTRA